MPPAGGLIVAGLGFEGSVRQEGHEGLAGQGHMDVLKLGTAGIGAVEDGTGGMGGDMGTQRCRRPAVGVLLLAVEVAHQL